MRTVMLALCVLVGCADPAPQRALLPCETAHCTSVSCTDDPSEPCVCHWPPAFDTMCANTRATLDRATACADQAELWCQGAGLPDGCEDWFTRRCMPSGPEEVMFAVEQAECLYAIVVNPTPRVEPSACVETWR